MILTMVTHRQSVLECKRVDNVFKVKLLYIKTEKQSVNMGKKILP